MPEISTTAELRCDDPSAAGINISPLTIEAHRRESFMEFTRLVVLRFVDHVPPLVDNSQAPRSRQHREGTILLEVGSPLELWVNDFLAVAIDETELISINRFACFHCHGFFAGANIDLNSAKAVAE
jgi:hypothetical protein